MGNLYSQWMKSNYLEGKVPKSVFCCSTLHTLSDFSYLFGWGKKVHNFLLLKKKLSCNGDTPEDKGCLGSSLFLHVPLPTWSACSCSCISNLWIRDSAFLWLLNSSWASCNCICSVGWWGRRATTAATLLVCSLGCWPAPACSPKMELGKNTFICPDIREKKRYVSLQHCSL